MSAGGFLTNSTSDYMSMLSYDGLHIVVTNDGISNGEHFYRANNSISFQGRDVFTISTAFLLNGIFGCSDDCFLAADLTNDKLAVINYSGTRTGEIAVSGWDVDRGGIITNELSDGFRYVVGLWAKSANNAVATCSKLNVDLSLSDTNTYSFGGDEQTPQREIFYHPGYDYAFMVVGNATAVEFTLYMFSLPDFNVVATQVISDTEVSLVYRWKIVGIYNKRLYIANQQTDKMYSTPADLSDSVVYEYDLPALADGGHKLIKSHYST
jgi:hypothetical protein